MHTGVCCPQARWARESGIAQQAIQEIHDRFKLAHGEEVAHASLHLIENLDNHKVHHLDDFPIDEWKANCALVLTCVAKQQK